MLIHPPAYCGGGGKNKKTLLDDRAFIDSDESLIFGAANCCASFSGQSFAGSSAYFDGHRLKISIHILSAPRQFCGIAYNGAADKHDRHTVEPNPVLTKKSPFVSPQARRL